MHNHLVAVPVDAGGITAQDHRQAVLGQADTLQRPHVVVVERGSPYVDDHPAVGDIWRWALTRLKAGQRVFGVDGVGVDGEHPATLTRAEDR